MALVDYSDSDESENDKDTTHQAAPAAAQPEAAKPTFKKFVNRSEANKIRINLPDSATTKPSTEQDDLSGEQPPAKKARLGGGGFNALLPAPKNLAKSTNGSKEESNSVETRSSIAGGKGLGAGINLRTGPTPSFSRAAPVPAGTQNSEYDEFGGPMHAPAKSADQHSIQPEKAAEKEVKLVGQVTRFKPMSVALNKKKKKPIYPKAIPLAEPKASELAESRAGEQTAPQPTAKATRSLFSTYEEPVPQMTDAEPGQPYVPMFSGQREAEDLEANLPPNYDETTETSKGLPHTSTHAKTTDLRTLANDLGLSEAERRQLFGRKGEVGNAKVAHFNLSAEYSHNKAWAESQEAAPIHNPVRSIAPGKHSLQQLMNAATSNQDALEESFASGKRNRQDAGSRYGW